jgi:hypothetical protein
MISACRRFHFLFRGAKSETGRDGVFRLPEHVEDPADHDWAHINNQLPLPLVSRVELGRRIEPYMRA